MRSQVTKSTSPPRPHPIHPTGSTVGGRNTEPASELRLACVVCCSAEDTLNFWKGIADVGLLGEVVTNISAELVELLNGVQQRREPAALQDTGRRRRRCVRAAGTASSQRAACRSTKGREGADSAAVARRWIWFVVLTNPD